ncbi:unnamed protein product [Chironomus riparius]|uniref:Uncharacterized protein n=1 Tax=Chironomus riparius TaxID=315576 RepID=A0A9N9WVN1_9DIPT|nr:unnamed protein product [Chironomus riparius]
MMWIISVLSTLPYLITILTIATSNTSSASITFQCSFQKDFTTFHHDFQYVEFYECFLKTPFYITTRNSTVDIVYGRLTSHASEKSNNDVTELFINRKTLHFMPTNFGEIFKNLKYLAVWNSQLEEINQPDLKQFPNLVYLCLRFNNFEYLDADLFKFNPKLEFVRLFGNKIKEIHTTAFEGLTSLKTLNLERNICVDKMFVNSEDEVKEFVENLPNLCQFSNEIANFTENSE